MNVARLNLSHGSHENHLKQIVNLRAAASELGQNIAIMIDTRGIEIRTGLLDGDTATLIPGESFSLYREDKPGNAAGVSITYQKLFEEVSRGIPILIDDGAIELEVENVSDGVINCRIIHGGLLGNSKSVNLPETQLAMSAVSPENRDVVANNPDLGDVIIYDKYGEDKSMLASVAFALKLKKKKFQITLNIFG